MALLIDRDWVTLADLAALDSEIPEIAESEGIVVEGEGGVIREAWFDCANWLETSFPALNHAFDPVLDSGRSAQNRFRVDQVVAGAEYGSRVTPIVDWMRRSALEAFYRSAVRKTTNDRYGAKLDDARLETSRKLATLKRAGVPVVNYPLPAPGATYAPWPQAEFDLEVISVADPGALEARTLYLAATWVSLDGTESGPSETGAAALSPGQSAYVSAASLAPPAMDRFMAPVGWRLYAGTHPGRLSAVLAGSEAMANPITARGAGEYGLLSNGQLPTTVIQHRNLILRG